MPTTITGCYKVGGTLSDDIIEVEVHEQSADVAIDEFKKVVNEIVSKKEEE